MRLAPRLTRQQQRGGGSRQLGGRDRPGRFRPSRSADQRPSGASAAGAAGPPPRRRALTTRAAVLGLVVCVVVLSLAYPLREYLSQRHEIAGLRSQQHAQQRQVTALEQQQRRLADPGYLGLQARQRLHYAKPGETTYIVIGPSPPSRSPGAVVVPKTASTGPWYDRLWRSDAAAGGQPANGGQLPSPSGQPAAPLPSPTTGAPR